MPKYDHFSANFSLNQMFSFRLKLFKCHIRPLNILSKEVYPNLNLNFQNFEYEGYRLMKNDWNHNLWFLSGEFDFIKASDEKLSFLSISLIIQTEIPNSNLDFLKVVKGLIRMILFLSVIFNHSNFLIQSLFLNFSDITS
jgi:hypothetical protein